MRNWLVLVFIIVVGIVGIVYLRFKDNASLSNTSSASQATNNSSKDKNHGESVTVVASNLDTPWALAFLPDGDLLVTQRDGTIWLVGKNGGKDKSSIGNIDEVREIGEGGLLGIILHPQFSSNNFLYLYYTYEGSGDDTLNRVVRMTFKDDKLSNPMVIVDAIPGATNHNGGRIKFGPDGMLYIATGDAQEPSLAQNTASKAGKILRVTDEGRPAVGNPFNNEVYSYGHRNVQGLAWNSKGELWATEHGRSGLQSGLDELNLIEVGKNYGWPEIQGNETRAEMETPRRNSGSDTWAPAGAAFVGNSLFFSGLRGAALYEAIIENGQVTDLKEHFKNQLGRIREVIVGSDGMLYISTSNQDGRGSPQPGDDKIIRVDPSKL